MTQLIADSLSRLLGANRYHLMLLPANVPASFCLEKTMISTQMAITPVIINRETVQQMLGGISRTTFYRKRIQWKAAGTPFPCKAPGTNAGRGGEQYRYCDVMRFMEAQGFVESTHD